MRSPLRSLARLILLSALALPTAAYADAVYLYTGQNFTTANSPYTTSNSVTGSVTFASAFAPNSVFASKTPLSFSFSDGLQTLTNQNATFSSGGFSTDANGLIINYYIDIESFTNIGSYISIDHLPAGAYDAVRYNGGASVLSTANNSVAGSFVLAPSIAPTPEPSSLALFGTGIVTLTGFTRRRLKPSFSRNAPRS